MTTSPNQHIETTTQDGISTISIRRADKKNALTAEMYTSLTKAFENAKANADVRVVLITGDQGCFTAGNDLVDFLDNPPTDEASPVFGFLRALSTFPKPLVAAVSGPAVGIGTTMLLHCDLVIADDTARFQLPFASLGLCPEAASSLLLPAIAGYQRAAEMLMLGEPFNAAKAQEIGLVNAVVSLASLLETAQSRAKKLAAQPAAAVRLTKQLMKRGLSQSVAETIRTEGQEFVSRLESPEAKEAFQAFIEKRKPDFSAFS